MVVKDDCVKHIHYLVLNIVSAEVVLEVLGSSLWCRSSIFPTVCVHLALKEGRMAWDNSVSFE